MENKLHLTGIISFVVLLIFAGCYFCGNKEEERMTRSATAFLAKQLQPEFQASLDNYIKAKWRFVL